MSTGLGTSVPSIELLGKTNISGYALHLSINTKDGRVFEELCVTSEDLEDLSVRVGLTPTELQERLTAKTGELTLKQLVTVLAFIRDTWSPDDVANFELSIDPIDPEFLGNYGPPQ